MNTGFWFVTGAPAELAEASAGGITLAAKAYVSSRLQFHSISPFDYVELEVQRTSRPGLPTSFGGLSGSALWHADERELEYPAEYSIPLLEGVAFYFYNDPDADDTGYIRCHGRESLYSQLLGKV